MSDKFFKLNASFRALRAEMALLGLGEIQDVEGCLAGTSHVLLFRQILFESSPKLVAYLLQTHGLSPASSDEKLVSTIFRICRSEFAGLVPPLSVDQFLSTKNFALKKIEFLTSLAKGIFERFGKVQTNASLQTTLCSLADSISALNERITDMFDSIETRLNILEKSLLS